MPGSLPATGSQISMGRVYQAFTTVAPGNATISLSGSVGQYVGHAAGTQISFSSRMGGRYYPYTY